MVVIGECAILTVARFYANSDRANLNCNRNPSNSNASLGMAFLTKTFIMKTHKNVYHEVYNFKNLVLAFKKARKGKTKKDYVVRFEENLRDNLKQLKFELMTLTYKPLPLKTFILRDPKTRKISKSAFRDRVIHHALCNIIEPIFDKTFIYDSCANRKGRGTLSALKRFEIFKRKATHNLKSEAFCFKADIKHYFQEVDHEILIKIVKKKVKDEKIIWLIKTILRNSNNKGKAMPLGNLTSQFFANVYLNELDRFVKHKLKARYYIRYVDDFVVLHESKEQLEIWKKEIELFLNTNLKLEPHPEKSRIISLSAGIDFVGSRNFYHFTILRKRNVRKISECIRKYRNRELTKDKIAEIFQGWQAHAKWANTYKLRRNLALVFT